MTTPSLANDIAACEGLRLDAYQDTGGVWTIGFGHTGPEVHKGLSWTLAQAEAALHLDIAETERQLDAEMPWWRDLNDPRQDVLANMAFNMGVHGLLGFERMLRAADDFDFEGAAADMLASKWASQVGDRAKRLAEQMRTGVRA